MLFSPCRSYMHLPCQYFQLSVLLNGLNYVIDLKKTLALTTIYVSEHFLIMLVVHICTCPVNMFSDIFFNRLAKYILKKKIYIYILYYIYYIYM